MVRYVMLPAEKSGAVERGLGETFGTTAIDDIQPITKAVSSDAIFRIVVKGSPYLLRIVMRVNEKTDPARTFPSMRTAAEGGVAPRVWYANIEDGVVITDFVAAAPLSITEARARIPRTLRQLHALAPFPKTFNYVTAHRFFIWKFRTANLVPASEVEEVFPRYERLCAAYPRLDADTVPTQGHLKPESIVFDGARIWLVDWDAAFMNDRYFDLAVAGDFVIRSDADERAYLEAYFGRPASDYEGARFFLMRQFLYLLTSSVYLILAAGGQPIGERGNVPAFHDFLDRVWTGEINLVDKSQMVVNGQVHWAQLLDNLRQSRFNDALRIVGNHTPQAEQLFPREV